MPQAEVRAKVQGANEGSAWKDPKRVGGQGWASLKDQVSSEFTQEPRKPPEGSK